MRARLLVATVAAMSALVVACTGHYTVSIGPDDGGSGSNTCMGELYDPCTMPSQCKSGICKDYIGSGFQVCTEVCTMRGSNSCPPDSTGSAGYCNNMELCKPTKPNACTQ